MTDMRPPPTEKPGCGIPGCRLHETPRELKAQDGDTMLVGLSMLIVVFLAGAGAGIMLASLW
jgi:hypothetical protein